MSEKAILLITGANQGLGYHAAQQLVASGKYTVLLGCRDITKGEAAVKKIVAEDENAKADLEPVLIDLTDDESIKRAAETVEKKYGRLDVLVNNAAISGRENASAGVSLRDQYLAVYDTNVFGQAVCTDAFIPLLRKSTAPGGKRIIFVSSGLASLTMTADLKAQFPGKMAPVYRSSKSAENMLSVHYGSLLEEEGFCVFPLCPGWNATNLNAYSGAKHPSDGAKVIPYAVEAKAEDVHWKFVTLDVKDRIYPW